MKLFTLVSLAAGCGLSLATAAVAASPSQADFDACNRAAQFANDASGSASPSMRATGPAITSPSGTPDSTSGVKPGGSAAKTGPMITGTGRSPEAAGGVGAGTGAISRDPASTPAPDDRTRGMSGSGQTDPAFRTAYQNCMKQRGF